MRRQRQPRQLWNATCDLGGFPAGSGRTHCFSRESDRHLYVASSRPRRPRRTAPAGMRPRMLASPPKGSSLSGQPLRFGRAGLPSALLLSAGVRGEFPRGRAVGDDRGPTLASRQAQVLPLPASGAGIHEAGSSTVAISRQLGQDRSAVLCLPFRTTACRGMFKLTS